MSLIEFPSRKEIRTKNLFSVSDVKMYWQAQGKYFGVKVDRFTKTKKSTYTGFELFRVQENDCPMEVMELPDKTEKVIAFAWEPKGDRFAVIHGDGPRPAVSFYSMKEGGSVSKAKLVITLTGKTANTLFWSPQGSNVILAGLKTMNGALEFYNADEKETMATTEHFMATDVEWDPTGRYVTTSVTSVHQMENGFNVWAFHGQMIYKVAKDRFFQFLWRPRVPSLLTPEREAEIKRNLKKYSKRYEEIDDALKNAASSTQLAERQEVLERWREWQQGKIAQISAPEYKAAYAALVAHLPKQDHVEETEVTVEETIDVVEEVLFS